MKQPATLDERISAAFKDAAKSEEFPALIADAEAASHAATAAAKRAREKALDPRCAAAEVTTARRAMEDAVFVSDRMNVAASQLRERHRAVAAKEEDCRRQLEYARVSAERDKLAKELADVYPVLTATLADLLHRVAMNNNEIASVRLPESQSRILEAELVARGIRGFPLGSSAVSIIEQTKLPAWENDVHKPYAYIVSDNMRQDAVVTQIRA